MLSSISLDSNELISIPRLNTSRELRQLRLNNNPLSNLTSDMFIVLPNIRQLSFNMYPSNMTIFLPSLNVLSIGIPASTTITLDYFTEVNSYLFKLEIRTSDGTLPNTSRITRYIKEYEITCNPDVVTNVIFQNYVYVNLKMFTVIHCNFLSFPEIVFNLPEVKYLTAAYCMLTDNDISNGTFGALQNLLSINLMVNELQTIPDITNSTTILKELLLNNNKIVYVSKCSLRNYIKLVVLDLSYNLIINPEEIPHLQSITSIYLR